VIVNEKTNAIWELVSLQASESGSASDVMTLHHVQGSVIVIVNEKTNAIWELVSLQASESGSATDVTTSLHRAQENVAVIVIVIVIVSDARSMTLPMSESVTAIEIVTAVSRPFPHESLTACSEDVAVHLMGPMQIAYNGSETAC